MPLRPPTRSTVGDATAGPATTSASIGAPLVVSPMVQRSAANSDDDIDNDISTKTPRMPQITGRVIICSLLDGAGHQVALPDDVPVEVLGRQSGGFSAKRAELLGIGGAEHFDDLDHRA